MAFRIINTASYNAKKHDMSYMFKKKDQQESPYMDLNVSHVSQQQQFPKIQMSNFKYKLQDFFDDPKDEAKLLAALQYYFKFGREVYDGIDPKDLEKNGLIDKGEWSIIMNAVLTTS